MQLTWCAAVLFRGGSSAWSSRRSLAAFSLNPQQASQTQTGCDANCGGAEAWRTVSVASIMPECVEQIKLPIAPDLWPGLIADKIPLPGFLSRGSGPGSRCSDFHHGWITYLLIQLEEMSNIIRTSAEIAAGAAAAGVLLFAWWRIRRRSWTVPPRDEVMRRHVHLHYS